jgi:hypothetical protein
MRSITRKILVTVAVVLGLAIVLGAVFRVDRPLREGVNMTALELCSKAFISGLDPARVFADSIADRAGQRYIARYLRYEVDTGRRDARVRLGLLGLVRATAQFHPGLGCIVIHGGAPANLPTPAQLMAAGSNADALLPEIAGPEVVAATDPRLAQAVNQAFSEPGPGGVPRRTKAVVVIHGGHVIAERYAPGYGVDTPLLGFSMTKSMINALVGVLVLQGRLKISDPAPVSEWSTPDDPRHAITIEQLMRMTSGLDLDEENAGFDNPSDRMLYLARDMAGFARSRKLIATPGTRFVSGGHRCLRVCRSRVVCAARHASCHCRSGFDRNDGRLQLHVCQRARLGAAGAAVRERWHRRGPPHSAGRMDRLLHDADPRHGLRRRLLDGAW